MQHPDVGCVLQVYCMEILIYSVGCIIQVCGGMQQLRYKVGCILQV